MPAGAVVCCVIGGGVHLIRDMAGNAGDANPDPNSEEGGCPAHNSKYTDMGIPLFTCPF